MKIEITKTTQTQETVEIELPYYYKHNLMPDNGENIIYGKIEEKSHHSIQLIHSNDGSQRAEVEREPTNWHQVSCYLKDEYRSNAKEYETAKAQAAEAIKSA